MSVDLTASGRLAWRAACVSRRKWWGLFGFGTRAVAFASHLQFQAPTRPAWTRSRAKASQTSAQAQSVSDLVSSLAAKESAEGIVEDDLEIHR